MTLRELLTRETVQMALVITFTLFVHYYFIRKRLLEGAISPPEAPQLEMPPTAGEEEQAHQDRFHGFGDDAMLG